MRTLEIVFTKSKKKLAIISWLIRIYTGKPYSHIVRKAYIGKNKREMYYQSSENKVNYEYKTIFLKKHEVVREYKLLISDEIYQEIADECLKQAGVEYATMQNLGYLYVDFMKKLGKNVENPWKKGKNCSELIYVAVFKKLLPHLELNPNKVKPHHIEAIIISNFKKLEDGQWRLFN